MCLSLRICKADERRGLKGFWRRRKEALAFHFEKFEANVSAEYGMGWIYWEKSGILRT
jgi:hypothetical protein